jgi:hypothetical protein
MAVDAMICIHRECWYGLADATWRPLALDR